MLTSYLVGRVPTGDILLVVLLGSFIVCLARRASSRKDIPPPGFVLVALSFASVIAGSILAVLQNYREFNVFWINLQHLLSYQGFALLPIMGIGPFILPRFFGLKSSHEFPETLLPMVGWKKKAVFAFGAGIVVIGSFLIEAAGLYRTAYGIRFLTVLTYAVLEFPLLQAPKSTNALGGSLRISFLSILGGFLAIGFFPQYRVGLLHLTLIGGFAVMTFVVATRVVFGHSGNLDLLKGRNRWLLVSVGLMLFGMGTRISGDFWPKIMASHYIYGALLWIGGALVWAFYVLPKVCLVEAEE
jgi:uncharacterized protein involved in response to NO